MALYLVIFRAHPQPTPPSSPIPDIVEEIEARTDDEAVDKALLRGDILELIENNRPTKPPKQIFVMPLSIRNQENKRIVYASGLYYEL